ncbi:apyrase 6 [Hibiscus trionum]|uniref:apyrase n=1 Tax=Hibiscus trionum TaxID=183268 RepID=A0A9W7IR39_HIBTR|nr:apyrase 6 [Hibiscus trionum]
MPRLHARKRVDSKPKPVTDPPKMDPIKFQIRPSSRSTALFSRSPRQTRPTPSTFAIPIVTSLALLGFSYVFLFSSAESTKFGIIIDGGSTGTRIHVFRYRVDRSKNPVFDFKEGSYSLKVNPGLSAYGEQPEAVSDSLGELLEFGRKKIPKEQWGETEIRLMATAGLRLLDVELQDKILEECRKVLRVSGFMFHDEWASVITGSDEGVYAWVVANYALGTLGGNPLDTTGIIELGGASAQVTFVSSEFMPSKFSRSIEFGNFTYNLYSHSFLHFGQDVAHESLRETLIKGDFSPAADSLHKEMYIDPCTPKGYLPQSSNLSLGFMAEKSKYSSELQARGNFSECRSAALKLLHKGKEKCSNYHCYLGPVFMPKLQGNFLATENFFYTSKFFRLRQRAFLSDLMMAGQHFCGEDWSKLKKKHQSLEEEELLRYCFSSAYIVALLHDSLGIALDDERISFANQVENIPLDWALGAFILQSTAKLDIQETDWITTISSSDSPTLFSIVAISAILMFVAWSISKWRKPQLKTVYDLEKGRYIVSRIGRS